MALTLVARSAVALSQSINAFYRVLKGSDPESVYLRLPTAGSFEVRHSVTNAPVVRVTDAGLAGIVQGGDIVDGSITSAEIADNTIVNADVNSAAAIAVTKLAHVGAGNVLKSTGTVNGPGQITESDVAPAAGISVTKLAHVGAGNVLKSNGTANVGGQVVNADVAAGAAISYSKLALGSSIVSGDIVDGTIVNADINGSAAIAYSKLTLANSIVTGDIVDGTLLNADVNAAAGIAISKLADVGANNVLRSSGAGNVAGKVVTNDMVINTIDADRLLNGSITAAKLGAGITAPASTLLFTSGVLAAPAASITFSPIPAGYTSLELRIWGRSTAAVTVEIVKIQVNGVGSASYYTQAIIGFGATTPSGEGLASTSGDLGSIPGASATAGWFGSITAWCHGYTGTGTFKVVTSLAYGIWGTAANNQQVQVKGTAANGVSGPVTSLAVFPSTGQWAAGTVAQLYGHV